MNGGFENDVLEMCSDDFEAAHTIAGDLSRELGRLVTEAEVREALTRLASAGELQAYVFESSSNQYVPISGAIAAQTEHAWFKRGQK